MKLKFTDGVEIETGGELRLLELKDGWYIAGRGALVPCKDEMEAIKILLEMANEENKSGRG